MENIEEAATGGASKGGHPRDCSDPSPFPVDWYTKQYSGTLEGRSISAMRFAGNRDKNRDVRMGRSKDTTIGAWKHGWWHWGGQWATWVMSVRQTRSPYVRWIEAVVYEWFLI